MSMAERNASRNHWAVVPPAKWCVHDSLGLQTGVRARYKEETNRKFVLPQPSLVHLYGGWICVGRLHGEHAENSLLSWNLVRAAWMRSLSHGSNLAKTGFRVQWEDKRCRSQVVLFPFSIFLAPTCWMHTSLSCVLVGFSSTVEANLQFLLFLFQCNHKQQRGEKSTRVPSSLMYGSVCTVFFYTGQNANKCTPIRCNMGRL